jgi:DNA-binding transcriptional MerR regulator
MVEVIYMPIKNANPLDKNNLDSMRTRLRDLKSSDKPAKISNRQAVIKLAREIKQAIMKGYTYEDIAELLAKDGLNLKANTIRNYAHVGTKRKQSPIERHEEKTKNVQTNAQKKLNTLLTAEEPSINKNANEQRTIDQKERQREKKTPDKN